MTTEGASPAVRSAAWLRRECPPPLPSPRRRALHKIAIPLCRTWLLPREGGEVASEASGRGQNWQLLGAVQGSVQFRVHVCPALLHRAAAPRDLPAPRLLRR